MQHEIGIADDGIKQFSWSAADAGGFAPADECRPHTGCTVYETFTDYGASCCEFLTKNRIISSPLIRI